MAGIQAHRWEFEARFQPGAFDSRPQPAIQGIKQAVSEIKEAARKDPVLGGEGTVTFLERVSPAMEFVDGSSGAIGTAVDQAIKELVRVIAGAPADAATRQGWLERLFEAHGAEDIPYINDLAEHWGELCGSPPVASERADRMIDVTQQAVGPRRQPGEYFHGSVARLSSLFRAGRYAELIELAEADSDWWHQRWVARALAAMGKKAAALRYVESCRGPYTTELEIDELCEGIRHPSRPD